MPPRVRLGRTHGRSNPPYEPNFGSNNQASLVDLFCGGPVTFENNVLDAKGKNFTEASNRATSTIGFGAETGGTPSTTTDCGAATGVMRIAMVPPSSDLSFEDLLAGNAAAQAL